MQPYQKILSVPFSQTPVPPDVAGNIVVDVPTQLTPEAMSQLDVVVFDEEGNPVFEATEQVVEVKENHYDNLALKLSEEELDKLGNDLVTAINSDIESRKCYYDKFVKGITALGINFDEEAQQSDIFGNINHPLLIEAATQFQARAMAELFPPDGPVKTRIVGKTTQELVEQAQRVQDYMNYQLVYDDLLYYEQMDQMLFMLPFTGSEFTKQFYDKTTGKVVSRWVRNEDMIVHYGQTDFESCPRYTHKLKQTMNDIKRLQRIGHYREVDLLENDAQREVNNELGAVEEKIQKIDGITIQVGKSEDSMRVIYEVHVDLDLPGYEKEISLPYIVTVDEESRKVLSIYRNWQEGDETYTKRVWFTHKKFLPGFGFYGFGFFHTIGGLGEAATKILQLLLDSGAFSSIPGGFKTKDAKLPANIELEPGVWKDVEATAEELSKAFFTPRFGEPSPTLFNLLGAITELGRRFAATVDIMVGDAANTGPVGTTVALVEQGSKVFSGIHKRLHRSFVREFKNIALLNYEQLEDDVYPYVVAGEERTVFKSDFDGRVDVIPVSDPNIFSNAQRLALAQTGLQLAERMPDLFDRKEAALLLLKTINFPDIDNIFLDRHAAERADPVTEMVMAIIGRPLRAYLEQDHSAHLTVHMGAIQSGMVPPQAVPILQAHIAEHIAMDVYLKFQLQQQQMGVPLPMLNWGAKPTENFVAQQLPPQVENMIALHSAQLMQQFQQMQPPQQQGADADKIIAAQINAQTQKEIAAINAQAKQQNEIIKAQARQAEVQAKAQMTSAKEAREYNEFLQNFALEREKFNHERQMDIAEFRKALEESRNKLREELSSMLADFEMKLTAMQGAKRNDTA